MNALTRFRTVPGAVTLALLGLSTAPALDRSSRANPASADPALARLSGRELARLPPDEETRLDAFRELSRRKGRRLPDDLRHRDLIVCPQRQGKPAHYLVLAQSLAPNHASGSPAAGDLAALFPAESPESPIEETERRQ